MDNNPTNGKNNTDNSGAPPSSESGNAANQGRFNTVLETVEEPVLTAEESANFEQNKIPQAQVINAGIAPKQEYVSKKGKSKLLFIVAGVMMLIFISLFALSKLKGLNNTSLCGKKGEIVWWGINYEDSDLSDLIIDYESKNNGVKIIYKKQSTADYRERLTNALANCDGPDIFEFHNSWPYMFQNDLSGIPAGIMSADDFKKAYYPIILSDLSLSKGIVGIPLEFDALTLFVNETLFSSAIKDPPVTWAELEDLAKLFTQKDDRGNIIQPGIPLGLTANVDHWPEITALMLLQNRASLGNPATQIARDAMDFYIQFYKDDGVWNESFPNSTTAFAEGKTPMYFGPSRRAVDIARMNSSLRFKTVPLPQIPKNSPQAPDVSYATYWVEGVWTRSSDKDDAWKFLKYISSKESLEKINSKIKERTSIERPSPYMDMAPFLLKDPIVGSVIKLAPSAKSWYLMSQTYDGSTGINSQVNEFYKVLLDPKDPQSVNMIKEKQGNLQTILTKYGIPRDRW